MMMMMLLCGSLLGPGNFPGDTLHFQPLIEYHRHRDAIADSYGCSNGETFATCLYKYIRRDAGIAFRCIHIDCRERAHADFTSRTFALDVDNIKWL